MQKLKSIVLSILTLTALTAPALVASPAHATAIDIYNGVCTGSHDLQLPTNTQDPQTNCETSNGIGKVNGLLTTVINVFSFVVGIIAVFMIIVGGLRYITSGGDSGKVTAAKTTIIYALVGLVIVALAQLIVRLVLNQAGAFISAN